MKAILVNSEELMTYLAGVSDYIAETKVIMDALNERLIHSMNALDSLVNHVREHEEERDDFED